MSGINLSPEEKAIHRVVAAVRQLMQGRSNAVGQVTLTAGQTTTVVTSAVAKGAANIGIDSEVMLSPRTANAAAALATTYVSSILQGSFTITHANNAQTDRIFGFEARG
ncbi:MAG: hypothetical protein WC670_19360 [Pseudolabrys sp.]|jgi:hypothetical protein